MKKILILALLLVSITACESKEEKQQREIEEKRELINKGTPELDAKLKKIRQIQDREEAINAYDALNYTEQSRYYQMFKGNPHYRLTKEEAETMKSLGL